MGWIGGMGWMVLRAFLPCLSSLSCLLFSAPELGGVRVARRARSENPADHDSDEQHGRNEDEMTRRHRVRLRRASVSISASTRFRRRQIVHTYTKMTIQT